VPALELASVGKPDVSLPGIEREARLPPAQERPVLECTVQLLLEHGICFQHEGLLVFPTLFEPLATPNEEPGRAASLYYDFAGAIDNIYASLVAWLVLARNFGRVRLSPDRAEFEIGEGGLCGLRKVGRAGGFAHIDVYFEGNTPPHQQQLFITFVEEHLQQNGVEIQEHVAINCACGYSFEEETLRRRIARGDTDVVCPVCEARHKLAEGAAEFHRRDASLAQRIWALKTEVEKRRQRSTEEAVRVIERASKPTPVSEPIRILHLSDLHFERSTAITTCSQWLCDDLTSLSVKGLDYLVVSGDFTDRGSIEGFEKAYDFVSALIKHFDISAERCIFVPGNHDARDLRQAYDWQKRCDDFDEGDCVKQGEIFLKPNPEKYPQRFKPFSDSFFHKLFQRPYPLDYGAQGLAIPFWDNRIQFLTMNSAWQIDQFHRKRAGVHPEAVARAVRTAQQQEAEARKSGLLTESSSLLRIGVWHHAVSGSEQMRETDFLGHLQNCGVRVAFHGDVHEMRRELIGYWHTKNLHVIGAGSFGARAADRPESTPRLYNLVEVQRNLTSLRIHTRCQPKTDGPWKGWNEWPAKGSRSGCVPHYEIRL
jgi:hypothetical protein